MRSPPPLTRQQIALCHVARRQLGLDDTSYRALLERAAGVRSAAQLDQRGFEAFMIEAERGGFRSTSAKKPYGRRDGYASPRQIALIRRAWEEWTGHPGEVGLHAWLERTAGVAHLRFLDQLGAQACITGLAAMLARKRASTVDQIGVVSRRSGSSEG